ncbi:hypothetical protein N0V93_008667 [Gnomoniopsis smithogilvyi]|uniref:Rhodopsin domain-containing protein n=1 Tax=Gnomoniopsis smithogilvyi TaxID=1191159 RepID=A0A9W8YQQ1_9PEZI|nr:hypothetical protein N0V93_008667 [Gnomoniopsis smithogilvyi]
MATLIPDHTLDGQSKTGLIIGLSAAFTAVNTVVVAARIYTRAIILHTFGIDDVFIIITQVMAIGLNVSTILEGHFGLGRHSWLASSEDSMLQLQCLFAAIELYIWSLCFVKLSLLLQYRRIFPAPWLQRVSLIIMIFACTWNVVQSILVSFACVPMSIIHPVLASKCLDSLTIWYIAAGINIVTDFIVWLLPIPLIQSLQLPLRQKGLLLMVFGLGLFTCVISIVRATTLRVVVETTDPSWYGSDGAIWSMSEVNLAILCSCLPTIRYLVAQILPCLGLRTQATKYLGLPYMSSKQSRKSERKSAFMMRSRKSQAGDDARLRGSNKTIGGSSDSPMRPEPTARPLDLMDTRWGIDHEKPGLYYHSNQISAWVSANHGEKSPTKSGAQSDDTESMRQLVDRRASDKDLSQQILITTTTTIKEGRAEVSPKGPPPGQAL